jgi:hypothetical protein
MRKLAAADIPELRAYNKERDDLRREIIALKARRRVALGPIVTLVFENTATVRWQVCEMVRAERIATEEGVATEVSVYNSLIPEQGELSATMFIELTDAEALRTWLPKLVGIHDAVGFELGDGSRVLGFDPEAERLTRDDITPAVHFLKFRFTPAQIAAFTAGPVTLAVRHPDYEHTSELTAAVHAELVGDLTAPVDADVAGGA